MNEIMNISGVNCYEENATAYLRLEDVARGLGFTQMKNNNEYVRWETVKSYLTELGFSQKVGKNDFIPENIFYRLAMKAKNETAERFQALVADEIIPSIRKHGGYLTPQKIEEVLLNPDTIIQLATNLKNEQEKNRLLKQENEKQKNMITEMKPKVDYVDLILSNPNLIPVTTIAKDYGMSATKFNNMLNDFGIQYKRGDQWFLYQKYSNKGYTHSKTYTYETFGKTNGNNVKVTTQWTQAGRLFLYDFLKERDIIPMIEKEN